MNPQTIKNIARLIGAPDLVALADTIKTVAAPPKYDDIEETMRVIFRKAGIPIGVRDGVAVKKVTVGYIITVTTDHTEISYKGLLRLRAYLTHKFKATDLTVSPGMNTSGAHLIYSIKLKHIKKSKDGESKLVKKPEPAKKAVKPADRESKLSERTKQKIKRRKTVLAAFERIQQHSRQFQVSSEEDEEPERAVSIVIQDKSGDVGVLWSPDGDHIVIKYVREKNGQEREVQVPEGTPLYEKAVSRAAHGVAFKKKSKP